MWQRAISEHAIELREARIIDGEIQKRGGDDRDRYFVAPNLCTDDSNVDARLSRRSRDDAEQGADPRRDRECDRAPEHHSNDGLENLGTAGARADRSECA